MTIENPKDNEGAEIPRKLPRPGTWASPEIREGLIRIAKNMGVCAGQVWATKVTGHEFKVDAITHFDLEQKDLNLVGKKPPYAKCHGDGGTWDVFCVPCSALMRPKGPYHLKTDAKKPEQPMEVSPRGTP